MKKISKTIESVCDCIIALTNETNARGLYSEELTKAIAENIEAVTKLISIRARIRMALGLLVAGIVISAIAIIVG